MFDMRRREEAEGESRIIGSGRRAGFLGRETRDVGFDEGVGMVVELGRGRFRPRNISADFRTCEKSFWGE